MRIEKTQNGLLISDIINGYRLSQLYIGHTIKQALKDFKERYFSFRVDGYLQDSNFGGYEIEMVDSYTAKVRHNYGQDLSALKPKTQDIKQDHSGRDYVTHYGRKLYLDEFMRAN
jgi:hypothetical protein